LNFVAVLLGEIETFAGLASIVQSIELSQSQKEIIDLFFGWLTAMYSRTGNHNFLLISFRLFRDINPITSCFVARNPIAATNDFMFTELSCRPETCNFAVPTSEWTWQDWTLFAEIMKTEECTDDLLNEIFGQF
jgi:hypothetical protein